MSLFFLLSSCRLECWQYLTAKRASVDSFNITSKLLPAALWALATTAESLDLGVVHDLETSEITGEWKDCSVKLTKCLL